MVKITNGTINANGELSVLTVSFGSYKAYYKNLGYHECKPVKKPVEKEIKVDDAQEGIVKPLSELTVNELKKMAEDNNIDLGKLKKKDDIITKITGGVRKCLTELKAF